MERTRRSLFIIVAAALFALVAFGSGCGGAQQGRRAQLTAGEMPEGGSWTGVYYNELYGYLHLVQDGNSVKGKWKRTIGDKWGELDGETEGNLLRFKWAEHTIGAIGPGANRKGRGYFRYSRPAGDNVDDRIDGEIGIGDDEAGDSTWDAIKQRRMEPKLDSIGTKDDASESGGEFDQKEGEEDEGGSGEDKGEEKKDEAPPPPPI